MLQNNHVLLINKKGRLEQQKFEKMLEYLEFKVQQHIPTCSSKKYLLKRVTAITEHNSNFKRLNNYVKLLSK